MSAEKAKAWLQKAENDLLAVDNNLAAERIPYDIVCFHCQQAAEKYLKAVLTFLDVQPSRTHDLLALLEEVRRYLAVEPPQGIENACVILTPYAVEVRYPDDGSNPTLDDAREARRVTDSLRGWAVSIISRQ